MAWVAVNKNGDEVLLTLNQKDIMISFGWKMLAMIYIFQKAQLRNS